MILHCDIANILKNIIFELVIVRHPKVFRLSCCEAGMGNKLKRKLL